MSNNPKKLQDPTEAALSAIQEALNLRDDASTSALTPVSAASVRPTPAALAKAEATEPATSFSQDRRRRMRSSQPPAPAVEEENFFGEGKSRAGELADEVPVERRAANDDRRSVGQILQALQRRPSSAPYIGALIFSGIWFVVGLVLASIYFGTNMAAFVRAGVVGPQLLGMVAAIVIPVVFFFVLAHMVWRTQELRGVARAMTEVAMRLAEPETLGSESIVTVGQAIRREVAAMGDGVERALARAAELEALVHNEVAALERAYNDNELRIRGLLEDIANQRDILVTQADQVRQALSGVQLGLTQDIASVSEMVASSVNEAAQRITRTLAEKGEHITMALGRAGDSMIDAVGERGGDLLEHLTRTSDDVSRALKEASDSITSSIDLKTDRLSDEVIVLTNNLGRMLSERLDQVTQDVSARTTAIARSLADGSKQISDSLLETGTRLAETVLARAEEANGTLKATGESLVLDLTLRGSDVVSKLEETGTKITDTIITRAGAVTATFDSTAESLAQSVNARADSIKDMLVSRLQSFEQIFSKEGAELGERISRDSGSLAGLITRHLAEFDRSVKVYGGELVERLGQRTDEVTEALRSHVENFDNRVGVKTNEAAAAFDTRITRLQEAIETRAQNLNDSLGARVMEMAKTLADGGREVVSAVENRISGLDTFASSSVEAIRTSATEAERTLTSVASGVASSFRQNAQDIEHSFRNLKSTTIDSIHSTAQEAERVLAAAASNTTEAVRTSSLESERLLNALASGVSGVLKQNAGEVEKTLLGVGAEVVRTFTAKAEEMAKSVSARASELTHLLDSKSGPLVTAIDQRGQQFSLDIDRVTVEAVKSIEAKGLSFGNTMMSNSQELARLINDASSHATTAVNRSLTDLQTGAMAAVEQSRRTASTAISEVMETHNVLRNDTTVLFDRLREANLLLQEVLTGATQNLGKIEATLSNRVSDFARTMNDIADRSGAANTKTDEHIKSFHAVTSNVLRDMTLVAEKLEEHGRALAAAADTLDKNNIRNDAVLAQRKESLEQLTTALDSKTEELDLRLKRFGTLLDQTFQAADAKARDIARTLAELSAEGARAINENFDLVRANAEQERKRTAEDMLSVYEQAAGDTNSLFRQASERFTEIVRDMKVMAAEMQRELESTRNEMRKGILELPQETAESAAQMRRVIVEQMDALAELNRIVVRHGRGIETTEPSRRVEPAVVTTSPRAAARAEAAPRSGAARKETAAAPTEARAGGWLSDVLSRASREEGQGRSEERNPRHAIESLDSLSVDIARMIDHDAASELWDRYKRGERNVFTRRLYTMQGQKTFDDIRKRYRGDREFKQTVDRYISEFERLLEEVSRNDRDSMVARTYLTSETGKVYTMLAHASGRLEN